MFSFSTFIVFNYKPYLFKCGKLIAQIHSNKQICIHEQYFQLRHSGGTQLGIRTLRGYTAPKCLRTTGVSHSFTQATKV